MATSNAIALEATKRRSLLLIIVLCISIVSCSKSSNENSKYLLDGTKWECVRESSIYTWYYDLCFKATSIDGNTEKGTFEDYYMGEKTGTGTYERNGSQTVLNLDCKHGVWDVSYTKAQYYDYDEVKLVVYYIFDSDDTQKRTYLKK